MQQILVSKTNNLVCKMSVLQNLQNKDTFLVTCQLSAKILINIIVIMKS